MIKKRIRWIGMMLALMLALSGCTPIVEEPPEQITVYATFYPIYALADMIARDIPGLTLNCLVQPQDGCLRSYTLSDWDLSLLLHSANGVLAGGCGLESFSERLEELSKNNFSLAEILYGLELYQGTGTMGEDGTSGHFYGGNPHLYLSVKGAAQMAESIAASFSVLDDTYADQYAANLERARAALDSLAEEIIKQTMVCNGVKTAILNEALFYPAQEYGMEITCFVERESGEELYGDALDDAIARIQDSGAQAVMIERQAPGALLSALEKSGLTVIPLDTLSAHSMSEGTEGYFNALRFNAKAAAEACAGL